VPRDKVLEIIEHDQRTLAAQHPRQNVHRFRARLEPEGTRDRPGHKRRVVERGKLDEPNAVDKHIM
jgi:hypothetical protein